ncbi:unnamed protein product [Caenorhabditis nigoni]
MRHEQLQHHNGFGYGGQPATTQQQQYRASMGAQQGLGGYTYPGYSHYQQGVSTSKGYFGCSYSNTQAARSRTTRINPRRAQRYERSLQRFGPIDERRNDGASRGYGEEGRSSSSRDDGNVVCS